MCNRGTNILNVNGISPCDDSIIKKEIYTYLPYTNSLVESDEIRIVIPQQDSYLLPSESHIYIQFTLTTKNHDPSEKANLIRFVKNFPSFLFSDARYELNGVEIDRIRNVGITSTMKLASATCLSNTSGYCQFNEAFANSAAQHDKTRTYDVMIPLSIWFGFCDDYRKLILNSRHELILMRARNSMNCISGGKDTAGSAEVSISIDKLEWKMPIVTLDDKTKWQMKNFLSKKIPVQYRSWDLYEYPVLPQTTDNIWTVKTVSNLNKPRYVLVGFQTDKKDKKTADASKFNHLKITSVRLYLNTSVYPYNMHEVDVGGGLFSELYQSFADIQSSYYNGLEDKNSFGTSYSDFQMNTIFAFDTSRVDESLLNGAVDIKLEIKAKENISANTAAYCLIIYENGFEYSPLDGLVFRCV